ncbi:nicolin-1-like isoform X2 [Pomacea canaliculata]|uniref:nicolin-1-like isoform X2 n=1 Tax=Pomacea canaliculata TaxID=400727 RepID=UPI000D73BEA1|nr:nicolin-1-like isoform X2 [Pomacea canaliculata]
MDKPLNYTVKSPVYLTLADGKVDDFKGCKVVDVTFPNIISTQDNELSNITEKFLLSSEAKPMECEDVHIGEIRFKNYYVAVLTVKAKFRGGLTSGDSDSKWKTCLKSVKLMPDPHSEEGSHDYFTFTNKQFCCEPKGITILRFILQQPSPVWKDFRMENLKLLQASGNTKPNPLPAWLMEESSEKKVRKPLEKLLTSPVTGEEERVPDVEQISSQLQQLWALAEEASSVQTNQSLGRFQIDGCYDVNLLAYT